MMKSAFAGKIALISGATSGVGLAAARCLIAEGAAVHGLGHDAERLAHVARELGPSFRAELADLSDARSRSALCQRLREAVPRVDLFLSCAAESLYASPCEAESESLSHLFELNVLAAVDLCRAVAPQMGAGGQIVLLSSLAARRLVDSRFGLYAASKAALEHFAEALRLELHPRGVHVSVVAPGATDTATYDRMPTFAPARRALVESVPVWLSAEDIADAVMWVCSRPTHVVVSELVLVPARQAL